MGEFLNTAIYANLLNMGHNQNKENYSGNYITNN